MIGIYGNSEDERLAMAYAGLTINDDAYPVASAVINPQYDSVREPRAQRDGMESYRPFKMVTMVRVDGTVEASSVAQLHDRVEAINAAFDPILANLSDDDSAGYLPFTFSVPTEDEANYPTGLKPMQYFARSTKLPVPRFSKFEGNVALFVLELECVDPRRYLQTEESHEFGGALYEVVDNSLASYPSWPIFTITMSGAGGANVDLDHEDDLNNCRLDLSGLAGADVVVVDMESKEITLNGVRDMSLMKAGTYWEVLPGTQDIRIDDMTGITSAVMSWRRAFV